MSVRILTGDCREKLAELPAESVHCVVTSPPYWGLRDYGVAGQIGLEADFRSYIDEMVAVFRQVRRVLRGDGTLWLNLGDSYNSGTSFNHARQNGLQGGVRYSEAKPEGWAKHRSLTGGLKYKDLVGIPWRVAFALQDDGWWLRQDIIWAKPNPMPESVTDRCTKAHEYLFLLSKCGRYWFDQAAVAEAAVEPSSSRPAGPRKAEQSADRIVDQRTAAGFSRGVSWGETRNKRSVWTVASEPFPEAHFATFPPALIEPCILAGCPQGGTVLDPFGGAGTTGLVADRLGRSAVLIELNPAYAEMARRRIEGDAPLLTEVA